MSAWLEACSGAPRPPLTLHLASRLLLGRYTAAAPGATEFLGDALAAVDRSRVAPREAGVFALVFGVVWKLALVVALIWVTVWALRKLLGPGLPLASPGALRVLSVQHLDARHAIWILELGERMLVVGGGGGHLALLATVESPVERAALREALRASREGGTFGSYLGQWAAKMGGGESKTQFASGTTELSERIARMRRERGGDKPE